MDGVLTNIQYPFTICAARRPHSQSHQYYIKVLIENGTGGISTMLKIDPLSLDKKSERKKFSKMKNVAKRKDKIGDDATFLRSHYKRIFAPKSCLILHI